jgi:hypothetical protein
VHVVNLTLTGVIAILRENDLRPGRGFSHLTTRRITMCTAYLRIATASTIAILLAASVAYAKKPDVPGGPVGGVLPAYAIFPIPSPFDSGSHNPALLSISDVSSAGEIFVVGYQYSQAADADLAHCWAVDAGGEVEIEDISNWFWHHDLDVNSAGVVCGNANTDYPRSPSVLLPNGEFISLQAEDSRVRLNNPDNQGIFQVVGRHVLWDITLNGTVLAATPLVDEGGTQLHACDVNDHGVISGFIFPHNDLANEQIPAFGKFVDGKLQIATRVNPSPDVITGFWDIQIDEAGNLLADGVEPAPTLGVFQRAVVWQVSGVGIDLASQFRPNIFRAGGIASIEGEMQVVCNAHDNTGTYPVLYSKGAMADLNQLAEGDEPWEIQGVSAINSAGVICGHGRVGKRRSYRAGSCLLIPTN